MVLVAGYGNPTRQDDGAGLCLAEWVQEQGFPDVEVRVFQQMHLELLEDAVRYESVLLLDCTVEPHPPLLKRVVDDGKASFATSHGLKPEVLLGLSRRLYERDLDLYLLALPGVDFGFGTTLSPVAADSVEKGKDLVRRFLLDPDRKNHF